HGGDDVGETRLVAGDGVEVALDDHRRALLSDRRARLVEAVQRGALVEQRGLGGIDVLALLIRAHGPAAEGDRPATPIADRDHQSVTEPVPQPVLVLEDQPGRDALVLAETFLLQVGKEAAALVRGVADPEGVDRLLGDTALGQVLRHGLSPRRAPERLAEVEGSRVVRLKQPVLELALLRCASRQLDAGTLRELRERFRWGQAPLLLQPGEHIASFTTTKALVCPALGVDVERRSLLEVKRAEANI